MTVYPLSRRLNMLRTLASIVENVNPDNGYLVDLTERVYIGKAIFGDEAPPPVVTFLESTRIDTVDWPGQEALVRKVDWQLLCQGWMPDGATDMLYYLSGCVTRELSKISQIDKNGRPSYPDYYRLGGLASQVRLGSPIVRPVTGAESAFFYLPLVVEFKEDLSAPFL